MTDQINNTAIDEAVETLKNSGIIAYPTEGVYGLGCDPFNETAVKKLYALKQRNDNKPFLLVASSIDQIIDLIDISNVPDSQTIFDTWPSATTWIFPLSTYGKAHLMRQKNTIALRVSSHPIIQAICSQWQKPIVSTSANISTKPSAKDHQTVIDYFGDQIDRIIDGKLGALSSTTPIFDAITKKQLR